MQSYTELHIYRAIQSYTEIYRAMQRYTELCNAKHYTSEQRYTSSLRQARTAMQTVLANLPA